MTAGDMPPYPRNLALQPERFPPDLTPLGDAAADRRTHAAAAPMLALLADPWLTDAPPVGLAGGWLRGQGWSVALLPGGVADARGLARLCRAIAGAGHARLLGTCVDHGWPGPSLAWSLAPRPALLRPLLAAHAGKQMLVFPADRGLAMLGDANGPLVFAGPAAAVRAAGLGWPAEAEDDLPAELLRHYAPFRLPG